MALAVLFAPALVDTPAVRAEIQRRLDAALQGQVTWQALEVKLLPFPHAELRQLRVDIPEKVNVTAEELMVDLRLWPLLRGSAQISSATLRKADIRALAQGGERETAPDPLQRYRNAIEPVARALQEFAPDMTLRIEDAAIDRFTQVNVKARTDAGGVDLELSAASGWWKRLAVDGRVEYADLSGRARVELDALLVDADIPASKVRAQLRTDAKSVIEGDFEASVGTAGSVKGKLLLPAGQLVAQLDAVDLAQALDIARRKVPNLDAIESAAGRLSASVEARIGPPWQARIAVTRSTAAVKLAALPAPLSVSSGSLQVAPDQLRFAGVSGTLLDAHASVSGRFSLKTSTLELSVADGVAGEKLVRWGLERGTVPQRLEPRTPLRFTAQRIAWAPQRPLEVDARLDFEGGPAVALALAWQPGLLELKRIAIKDAASDATASATIAAKQIQGGFSGTLQGATLGALLRTRPPEASGIARGELRFTLDRAQPARSVAEGTLRVEALDLSWLAGKRAIVEAIDLSADKSGIRIANAALDLEEQRFRLSGTVQRTEAHPRIDARLESPGVDLVRLLPPPRERKPGEKETALWPLPVRGRVEVRSAFIEHTRYRVEPFDGVLSLEPERARLEVKQARMCGVSFPLELEATPRDATLDIHVAMKDQPFEKSLHCMTGGTVEIIGNADLTAELHTRGHRPHLLRDLTGSAQVALRDGRVKKFSLLGNILSVRNIGSVKRMHEEGFAFRTMHARGSFKGGTFLVDEAAFDSDALNLAATGRVDLLGSNSRLTMLVGLLTGIDRVAGAIPIVGDIFGGSLTALPVEVSGDIRDPLVVPLGPRAVSGRLLEILGNTAKVPGKLLVPKEAAP